MPTIAEIIHQRHDDIVALWIDETRKIAAAKGLPHVALKNVMPRYLAALGTLLGQAEPDAADEHRRRTHFQSHLSTRIRQGYHLAEIIHEFVTLGRCISRMWSSTPLDRWPASAEIERLHDAIQTAITDATDTFHQHMLEDEQTEKRYVRQLQAIASAGLQDAPLGDRLRDMLVVIMEAMQAQCAALLLIDVRRSELVLVASTGDEVLEPYVSSLDPKSSFVAQVASNEEATHVFDSRATTLEVPQALAKGGIRALLGVRLPSEQDLRGVMYVGMMEPRDFAHREVRRIEALGERFALHLENARLFDLLREKIESLHVERSLRERFVALLAHDLRGPLGSARLAADLLRERSGAGSVVDKLETNLDRADRMIRDLLDANRIRAGETLPLRFEACELCKLVNQVVDEARALHGDRFVVRCGTPIRGFWSADELYRTLWNLVINAVKYGARKPITIEISRVGNTARLAVHNEGIPIPADDLPRIFDAYARTTGARDKATGWGLGLTLVRGCVEAHGGHVGVTSDAASGTTFTIELPLDARPFQADAAPPRAIAHGAGFD